MSADLEALQITAGSVRAHCLSPRDLRPAVQELPAEMRDLGAWMTREFLPAPFAAALRTALGPHDVVRLEISSDDVDFHALPLEAMMLDGVEIGLHPRLECVRSRTNRPERRPAASVPPSRSRSISFAAASPPSKIEDVPAADIDRELGIVTEVLLRVPRLRLSVAARCSRSGPDTLAPVLHLRAPAWWEDDQAWLCFDTMNPNEPGQGRVPSEELSELLRGWSAPPPDVLLLDLAVQPFVFASQDSGPPPEGFYQGRTAAGLSLAASRAVPHLVSSMGFMPSGLAVAWLVELYQRLADSAPIEGFCAARRHLAKHVQTLRASGDDSVSSLEWLQPVMWLGDATAGAKSRSSSRPRSADRPEYEGCHAPWAQRLRVALRPALATVAVKDGICGAADREDGRELADLRGETTALDEVTARVGSGDPLAGALQAWLTGRSTAAVEAPSGDRELLSALAVFRLPFAALGAALPRTGGTELQLGELVRAGQLLIEEHPDLSEYPKRWLVPASLAWRLSADAHPADLADYHLTAVRYYRQVAETWLAVRRIRNPIDRRLQDLRARKTLGGYFVDHDRELVHHGARLATSHLTPELVSDLKAASLRIQRFERQSRVDPSSREVRGTPASREEHLEELRTLEARLTEARAARDRATEVDVWVRKALLRERSGPWTEAVRCAELARNLAVRSLDPLRQARTAIVLAELLQRMGEWSEATDVCSWARKRVPFEAVGELAGLDLVDGRIRLSRGDVDAAWRHCEGCLSGTEPVAPALSRLRAWALVLKAEIHERQGEWLLAEMACDEAIATDRESAKGRPGAAAAAHLRKAYLLLREGRDEPAEQELESCQAWRLSSADLPGLAECYQVRASLLARRADTPAARTCLNEAIGLFEHVEDVRGMARALMLRALICEIDQQFNDAHDACERGIRLFERLGDQRGTARGLVILSTILERIQRPDEAVDTCRRGLKLHRNMLDRGGESNALQVMVDLETRAGMLEDALQDVRRSLDLAAMLEDDPSEAVATHQMAVVLALQQDLRGALELWNRAIRLYLRVGDTRSSAAARHQLGVALMQEGQPLAGVVNVAAALTIADTEVAFAERLRAVDLAEALDQAAETLRGRLESFVDHPTRVAAEHLDAARFCRFALTIDRRSDRSAEWQHHLEAALETYQALGQPEGVLDCLRERLELARVRGEPTAELESRTDEATREVCEKGRLAEAQGRELVGERRPHDAVRAFQAAAAAYGTGGDESSAVQATVWRAALDALLDSPVAGAVALIGVLENPESVRHRPEIGSAAAQIEASLAGLIEENARSRTFAVAFSASALKAILAWLRDAPDMAERARLLVENASTRGSTLEQGLALLVESRTRPLEEAMASGILALEKLISGGHRAKAVELSNLWLAHLMSRLEANGHGDATLALDRWFATRAFEGGNVLTTPSGALIEACWHAASRPDELGRRSKRHLVDLIERLAPRNMARDPRSSAVLQVAIERAARVASEPLRERLQRLLE